MSKAEFFWLSFFLIGTAFAAAENRWPARKSAGEPTVPADIASVLLYQLLLFPLACGFTDPLESVFHYPHEILDLPWIVRLLIFYVVADLGAYWIHRLEHTKYLWRVHKWHHSPTVMYWLAGVRGSFLQQVLSNLPYIVVIPILGGAPQEVYVWLMLEGIFRNNFMHMNVVWRSNMLELFFVTPRFHHIHHSVDITTHGGNYGVLFTFWDRLFRTYRNPDNFTPTEFGTGTGDTDSMERMIVGF